MRGSHGGVAVEADVQVILQSVHRVPGQPLQQHVVETLHQSTLHTHDNKEEKLAYSQSPFGELVHSVLGLIEANQVAENRKLSRWQ